MPEHEPQDFESCAICGRTILRGERVADYVTTDGERHRICALCKDRAEAAGWIPAEHAAQRGHPVARRSRGRALRGALSRAAERVRQPRSEPEMDPRPSEEPVEAMEPAQPARETPREERAQPQVKAPAQPHPKARPEAKGKQPATPAAKAGGAAKPKRGPSAETRMRRAVDRFNESEASRTVAALMKSLGEPNASVQSVSAKPPKVTVTVAWELSWYRWEVSQDGDAVNVTEVAKGDSVEELTDKAKRWNASVDEDGTVRLRTASKQRATAKAE